MSQLGHLSSRIRSQGAEPVAVAVTATFSQLAFGDTLGIDFPMLSDWEGKTAAAYGVQYDEWKGHSGLAKRSVFVIDGSGLIRYRWVTEDALVEPDIYEVVEFVEALSPLSNDQ